MTIKQLLLTQLLLETVLATGLALLPNPASAESSISNASVSVPEACTMTGSGMNSHTATITPGTFSASTGSDYENGIGKTTYRHYRFAKLSYATLQ